MNLTCESLFPGIKNDNYILAINLSIKWFLERYKIVNLTEGDISIDFLKDLMVVLKERHDSLTKEFIEGVGIYLPQDTDIQCLTFARMMDGNRNSSRRGSFYYILKSRTISELYDCVELVRREGEYLHDITPGGRFLRKFNFLYSQINPQTFDAFDECQKATRAFVESDRLLSLPLLLLCGNFWNVSGSIFRILDDPADKKSINVVCSFAVIMGISINLEHASYFIGVESDLFHSIYVNHRYLISLDDRDIIVLLLNQVINNPTSATYLLKFLELNSFHPLITETASTMLEDVLKNISIDIKIKNRVRFFLRSKDSSRHRTRNISSLKIPKDQLFHYSNIILFLPSISFEDIKSDKQFRRIFPRVFFSNFITAFQVKNVSDIFNIGYYAGIDQYNKEIRTIIGKYTKSKKNTITYNSDRDELFAKVSSVATDFMLSCEQCSDIINVIVDFLLPVFNRYKCGDIISSESITENLNQIELAIIERDIIVKLTVQRIISHILLKIGVN